MSETVDSSEVLAGIITVQEYLQKKMTELNTLVVQVQKTAGGLKAQRNGAYTSFRVGKFEYGIDLTDANVPKVVRKEVE